MESINDAALKAYACFRVLIQTALSPFASSEVVIEIPTSNTRLSRLAADTGYPISAGHSDAAVMTLRQRLMMLAHLQVLENAGLEVKRFACEVSCAIASGQKLAWLSFSHQVSNKRNVS